jgi:copper chaperone CopZ
MCFLGGMRIFNASIAGVSALVLGLSAHAAEVIRTMYVPGMECGSCVFLVQQAAESVRGVKDVQVVQQVDGYVRVKFDPDMATEHRIAQAIREAPAVHGTPYQATLRLRALGGKSAVERLRTMFGRWSRWLSVSTLKEPAGIVLSFKDLKQGDGQTDRGWSTTMLREAFTTSRGEDGGFEIVEEKP